MENDTPPDDEANGAQANDRAPEIKISNLDRAPAQIEPPARENFRGIFAGVLLAVFVVLVLGPLFAALFVPDRLDGVLKVTTWGITPTGSLLGAIIGFYYGARSQR